eukprot:scaffold31336_cov129-Isochrysis_galbana.AAC.2
MSGLCSLPCLLLTIPAWVLDNLRLGQFGFPRIRGHALRAAAQHVACRPAYCGGLPQWSPWRRKERNRAEEKKAAMRRAIGALRGNAAAEKRQYTGTSAPRNERTEAGHRSCFVGECLVGRHASGRAVK